LQLRQDLFRFWRIHEGSTKYDSNLIQAGKEDLNLTCCGPKTKENFCAKKITVKLKVLHRVCFNGRPIGGAAVVLGWGDLTKPSYNLSRTICELSVGPELALEVYEEFAAKFVAKISPEVTEWKIPKQRVIELIGEILNGR